MQILRPPRSRFSKITLILLVPFTLPYISNGIHLLKLRGHLKLIAKALEFVGLRPAQMLSKQR
jgi:ABC-type sulfate transport system permease component